MPRRRYGKQEFRRALGRRIHDARKRAKLTQEELAESAGIATETLSRLEKGRVGVSLDALILISERLAITLSQLFDWQVELPNAPNDIRERELMAIWRELDTDVKDLMVRIARDLGRFQHTARVPHDLVAAERPGDGDS